MNILDSQVDWHEDVGNDPRLEVLVDETPHRSELRFEHEESIWCAIQDGYVEYFAWSGNGNEGGYTGDCFDITTVDGESITLRGPWSSRAGCVNNRSFGPVVDVRLTTNPEALEHGHTFKSATLTLSAAKQAINLVDEACQLERMERSTTDEQYWVPVREDGGAEA